VAILLLASCGAHRQTAPGTSGVPELPRLVVENFQPKIRERVQQAYQEAQSHPSDAGASGKLGMVLHAFEQYDGAEVCYRRARGLDPRQFQWAYYLGMVDALNGKNEDAAAALRDAAALDVKYLPARLKLAEVLLTLRRLDESEAVLQSIARDDAGMAPAYYWMGRVAEARGRGNEAAQQYRRACELWPSYATAHYALALVSGRTGDAAAARQEMAAYEKYKANGDPQPEDPLLESVRALDNTALAHLMKGVDLENGGRLQEAVAEHEEAVKLDPKLAQAHANLIALYARLGRPQDAEREYLATIAINPSLPQSHYDYGVFLVSQSRFGEAEAAFRKALASSPNYAEAHSNLGAMLERQGKLNEARKEYQAAVESKPNFRQAHFQLGRLLLMMKRPGDAIPQLSQTLTPEDGDTPRFMYALGVAYAESGDYASAGRWLRDAGGRAAAQGQDRLAAEIGATLRKVEQRAAR
jgi:tetratricopeptide (TPR) repeat protein